MTPHIIILPTVTSTNDYLRQHSDSITPPAVVIAIEQTAGRGQRGNHWEALPAANITMSMLYRPTAVAPARQFALSTAVALAVADVVSDTLGDAFDVSVKWPNDIYVGDLKIAGLLLEHVITGPAISRTIIGIGLNVNQPQFDSDAPNPVSLTMLTGRHYDIMTLLDRLVGRLCERLQQEETTVGASLDEYNQRLWRAQGHWPWITPDGQSFDASIDRVEPDGRLILNTPDGPRPFYFKQVHPII